MDKLPAPKDLFSKYPPGIRIFLFDRFLGQMDASFNKVRDKILKIPKIGDRLETYIEYHHISFEKRKPYSDERDKIERKLIDICLEAKKLEKDNNIDRALYLYNSLANDFFFGSTPYDRLRVIYSRHGEIKKAILICQRYIDVLNIIKEIEPGYQNIKMIPEYKTWIKKLEAKL